MPGTLYIVGTPIGNLEDLSPRAVRILSEADFIAAEDTRVTRGLMSRFGIKNELVAYHDHNKDSAGSAILDRLSAGESCALVTDAGMPAISDPGENLVRLCHDSGVTVASVPGPTAVATALALSGLPTGRFTFEGFLAVANTPRKKHLDSLRDERRTMVFYEAPHKLTRTLSDMLAVFGDRQIALVREMTKLYEEVERTTLEKAAEKYREVKPRGEYVIVIEGKKEEDKAPPDENELIKRLDELIGTGLSRSDAVKALAAETGLPKNAVYRLANISR
ncbi:MAG: 16S rRNA (cytidine(1402)-2'-O)-methyltransferase [Clostridia bacterium]|nr:16S rRNA (cytidine(1402)-2'-O)-methyltransferase [Clostridia bacterium]